MSSMFETSHTCNDEWKLWCRLCAKEDTRNINVFSEDNQTPAPVMSTCSHGKLLGFIEEFFRVRIEQNEDLPHWLCAQCFSLISTLAKFFEHVRNVQDMYDAIQHSEDRKTLDLQVFREKYNLLGNELPMFNLLDTKSTVENILVEPDIMVQKSLDNIVKSEIISDEVQSGVFCNEFEYKSEFQDPLGDAVENTSTEVKSGNYTNNRKEDINIKVDEDESIDKDETIDNHNERHSTRKLKKKLKTRSRSSVEESTEPKYFCGDCSMQFQRIGNYRIHLKKKHGRDLEPLKCPKCSRSFVSRFKLDRHIKTHLPLSEKRIFPCPQCDRKFQTKDYVATHIKFVHEDIRPFICEECGEGTRTEAALREHMLTHTDLTPFECEVCKKAFKNESRLKNHMEIHSPSKHICSECGLQLNSRVTLNRHMLVHSDVMRHKCDYCGRAFKRAKTLKTHLILHSGLKPYSCEFCDKTFTNGSNCRTHMKRAHTEDLAALEASGEKTYTKNIPKLAVLKRVTRSAENLIPVVTKQSGNFSLGRKPKIPLDCTTGTKQSVSPAAVDTTFETKDGGNLSTKNSMPSWLC
ncbi:zinc finger protein 100-like isoform X1 [Anastrepha ludens]|uniref:zinc finger protein 100-like isoform X1 n=1 Tax=Anastrepha ludens TaxID=28586 RepID=UPI0023AED372|nr:zinc finger protein 100-like isoform X1 [Anastrepha ludens]